MTRIEIHDVTKLSEELAARIAAGETIVVTRDGQPIADLVPRRRNLQAFQAAVEAWKRQEGVDSIFEWDPETFDEPIDDETFLQAYKPGT